MLKEDRDGTLFSLCSKGPKRVKLQWMISGSGIFNAFRH